MSGWTFFRWIRRLLVQTWPSIILMTCKRSIECTILIGFYLDHMLLGQIELNWVSDCLEIPLGTSGYSLQKIGQDHSVTDHTCPIDAQSSDGEKHTGNSEWHNACGGSHGKETKRPHGTSSHGSRTADIYTNRTGPSEWGDSKIGFEDTLTSPTTRRHSTKPCWRKSNLFTTIWE